MRTVRKRTPKYIVFLDDTSRARAMYSQNMNDRTQIQVVICAELSKFGHAEEQIHVHLISQRLEHIT